MTSARRSIGARGHNARWTSTSLVIGILCLLSSVSCNDSSSATGGQSFNQNQGGEGPSGTLESLSIDPNQISLPMGESLPIAVTGFYSSGSAADVTEDVQWSVSGSGVVEVKSGSPALLVGSALGSAEILAQLDGVTSNSVAVEVMNVLETLELKGSETSLEVGDVIDLDVEGHFSDGSKRDLTDEVSLSIGDSEVIELTADSPPQLVAVAKGSSFVSAALGEVSSNPLLVFVGQQAESGWVSSVSQFGITWTFDGLYEVGQYINGDYWVVGPVTIGFINPPSRRINGRVRNGSMINVKPGLAQGWDSTLYGSQGHDGIHYDEQLNVAFNVSWSKPLVVEPGSSLISSISKAEAGAKPGLKTAAVLTVVGAPPPEGTFRPPYAGSQRPFFNFSQVKAELLGNLPAIGDTPDPDAVANLFKRVWLEHLNTHLSKYQHPEDNMPWYGRDMAEQLGRAALLLQADLPLEKKKLLLIRFLQVGIDFDRLRKIGMYWPGNGGHMVGRKFPILFKRVMFGQTAKMSGNPTRYSEDDQTFYVEETSPGVYNHGFPKWNNPLNHAGQCVGIRKYGPAQLGMPEWSHGHWSVDPVGAKDPGHSWSDGPTLSCENDNHRFCCTYRQLAGHFLAAHAMGLREKWNWDPAFDYMDRYMQIAPGWQRQKDAWVENMWDQYRHTFAGYDPVPGSWIPVDLANP